MKNQIMVRDGNHLISLVSDNFFIDYDENSNALEIRFGKEKYSFRNIRTTTIPDGKSLAAVSQELACDYPVFKVKNS